MTDNRPRATILNELMQECFRLNRGLLDVSQQLTDGTPVTGAQWGVLTALAQGNQKDEPATVAETARRMGLARQSVQRVTDVLADNGLVKYLPNPDDKRAKFALVTPAGRRLLARLEDRQLSWVSDIVAGHSAAELTAAMQLIKDIRNKMTRRLIEEDRQIAAG